MENYYVNVERKANHPFNSFIPFGVIEYRVILMGFLSVLSFGISIPLIYPAFRNLFFNESLSAPETLNNLPLELIAIFSDI